MAQEFKGEKRVLPPRYEKEPGGVPHVPTDEEMRECDYAKRVGEKCPRIGAEEQAGAGVTIPLVDCATCLNHPHNAPVTEGSMTIEIRPGFGNPKIYKSDLNGRRMKCLLLS